MKLYRLIGIILVLESRDQITAKELADRFEVSIRTIYRDLDVLSQAGIPIVSESGPGGGISLMNGYRFRMDTLDQNELSLMMRVLADQEIIDGGNDSAQNMVLKVKKALPSEAKDQFDRLLNSIKVDLTGWFGNQAKVEKADHTLDLIKESILTKKKLSFDYINYHQESCNRILQPYGLVKKAQVWYLVGYCEQRQEVRTFNCKRIKNSRIEESTYSLPPDFDLDQYWQEVTNQFSEIPMNKAKKEITESLTPDFPVTIRCHEKKLGTLNVFPILFQEQDGDICVLTIDLINEKVATQQLLFDLDEIVILEPDHFRKGILSKVENILKNQKH